MRFLQFFNRVIVVAVSRVGIYVCTRFTLSVAANVPISGIRSALLIMAVPRSLSRRFSTTLLRLWNEVWAGARVLPVERI